MYKCTDVQFDFDFVISWTVFRTCTNVQMYSLTLTLSFLKIYTVCKLGQVIGMHP